MLESDLILGGSSNWRGEIPLPLYATLVGPTLHLYVCVYVVRGGGGVRRRYSTIYEETPNKGQPSSKGNALCTKVSLIKRFHCICVLYML